MRYSNSLPLLLFVGVLLSTSVFAWHSVKHTTRSSTLRMQTPEKSNPVLDFLSGNMSIRASKLAQPELYKTSSSSSPSKSLPKGSAGKPIKLSEEGKAAVQIFKVILPTP